ncbi:PAS domain-containing protein, partial [Enterococcus casseliflavus]|uniref:PAS domain-containing protein n=1 Tax=Enterococcus casseliflavus TaxID=37734 RepID=UPI003D0D18C0
EMFGPSDDWVGRTAVEILGPEIGGMHDSQDRPLLEGPASVTYERRMERPDVERRELLYSKTTFVDREGQVGGLIATVTDVTRYK